MFSNLAFILFFPIFSFSSIINGANIEKLPFCKENSESTLVLVSTIDGKLSAVSSEGNLLWQINTDPGPLLTSNIHNLELTNNGRWVRIIPSLSGTLYRFDGNTIDPIPITAESLLKSSFKYSDDLVIAGGMEVWTYGVGLRTGKVFYICSTSKCKNKPDHNNNDNDDVLLIERNSQTVRAIDPQSGQERWNFSVGHHNIKLTQTTCRNPNANLFDWNITAVIPDGLLLASSFNNNVEITWQYHFPSPIVRIWKWNGIEFNEIDLFSMKNLFATTSESQVFPAIYIGMHNKQLYIHESNIFQHLKSSNINVISDTKIPWKPISASGILTEDDSTALSILYNSEYVNGNGYYLFTEFDLKQKNSNFCGKNYTIKITQLIQDDIFKTTLKLWWKEICLITFTTMIVLNLMLKTFAYRNNNSQEKKKKQQLIINENNKNSDNSKLSSSMNCDTNTFNSRYLNDFETVKCLGKGGFGVVFEVKQKIDECHYAIKRITLPNENKKRDAVMREVKALAKLEHNNIVRYFNSWVEYPPLGWNREYDNQWLVQDEMTTMSYDNTTTTTTTTTTTNNDNYNNELLITTKSQQDDDSFIVFKNDLSDTVISSNNNGGNGGDGGDGRGGGGGRCRGGGRGRGGDRGRSGGDGDRRSLSTNFSTNTYKQDQQTPPVFLYIQMQLCQECSLRDWLMKNNQRDSDKILDIFKQIVAAVEYVHLRGLIHRDLKPSNIFFSLDGQIKIGDFGLVKDIEDAYDNVIYNFSPIKSHTKNVGTRLYMSPEQLNGKQYNYKVDIYSLGLIFFELLVHFTTDMERIVTLNKIKENDYPGNFLKKHPKEHELLTMMLSKLPEKRLTTFGIRARPPISDNKCNLYDYELPTLLKNSSLPSSLLSSSSFSSSKT